MAGPLGVVEAHRGVEQAYCGARQAGKLTSMYASCSCLDWRAVCNCRFFFTPLLLLPPAATNWLAALLRPPGHLRPPRVDNTSLLAACSPSRAVHTLLCHLRVPTGRASDGASCGQSLQLTGQMVHLMAPGRLKTGQQCPRHSPPASSTTPIRPGAKPQGASADIYVCTCYWQNHE